jgi:hypothetical protein
MVIWFHCFYAWVKQNITVRNMWWSKAAHFMVGRREGGREKEREIKREREREREKYWD